MTSTTVEDAYADVPEHLKMGVSELRTLFLNIWNEESKIRAMREFAAFPTFFCPDLNINNEYAEMLSQMYIDLTLFFRIQDCAIDEKSTQHGRALLCGNIILAHLMKALRCFPSRILDIVEKTFLEYSESSAYEIHRYSFDRNEPVSQRILDFSDISFLGKKFSPLKIPLAAAVILSQSDSLEDVNAIFDNYGVALQVRNDIMDWQEDYNRGQMTYFLSTIIKRVSFKESWPETAQLKEVVVFSNAVEEMVKTELEYMKKTKEISNSISRNLSMFFERKIRNISEDINMLKLWKKNFLNTDRDSL